MRSEIEFLKRALNRSPSAGPFGCYHIYGGVAYAQNEQMQAVVPFPEEAEFSAPGAELEIAVSRMASEPFLDFSNGILTVKAGRLRATVPCVECEPPAIYSHDVEWVALPDNLIPAIRTALPFMIGNQMGWSSSIRLQDERLTSLNNKCGIDIGIPGLVCPPSLLTKELAEFLLATDPPAEYSFKEKTAFLFRWDDGRVLQVQLIDQVMPGAVETIFANAGQVAPTEITVDWRAAYEDAAAITESIVEVRSDSIRIGRGSSKVTIEVEAAIPEGHVSYWETKVLTPMLGTATHWNPAAYPKPALFKGPGLYGLVSGIRQ